MSTLGEAQFGLSLRYHSVPSDSMLDKLGGIVESDLLVRARRVAEPRSRMPHLKKIDSHLQHLMRPIAIPPACSIDNIHLVLVLHEPLGVDHRASGLHDRGLPVARGGLSISEDLACLQRQELQQTFAARRPAKDISLDNLGLGLPEFARVAREEKPAGGGTSQSKTVPLA